MLCSFLPQSLPIPVRHLPLPWDRIIAVQLSSALHESAVNHSEEEEGFGGGGGELLKLLKLFSLSNYKLNKTFFYLGRFHTLVACSQERWQGVDLAGGRF